MIFKFTARCSLSGLANRGVFSNTLCKAMDVATTAPEVATFALAYGEALKDLMTTDVHFLDVKVTPVAANGLNAPDMTTRTVFLSGTGTRTPLDGVVQTKTMPLDVALEISKNTLGGRPGRFFVRGAIGEDELTVGADGEYVLDNPAGFWGGTGTDATMLEKLNALCDPDEPLVIPNVTAVSLLALTTSGRTITSFSPGGVVILKRNRKRVSAEAAAIAAVQREINNVSKKIKRIIQHNSGWAEVAGAVAVVAGLLALPEAAVAALPAGAAASLDIPAIWGTAATAAETTSWWTKYGTTILPLL